MEHKKSLLQQSGINVNYHCELMQNYVSESVIDFGKGLQTVKTTEDEAFLFFIDKKAVLQVLVHSKLSGSGWKRHRISSEGYEVTSFGIYENQDEINRTFRLSYAQKKNGVSELLVSENLFVKNIDCEKWECDYQWKYKDIERKEREIDHISMDEQGVLYSTNFTKTDANFYYFQYDSEPQVYSLPENGNQVIQINLGKANGHFGVFLLYYVQNNKTLLFRAIKPDKYGETAQYRFNTDYDIQCFDLLPDAKGNSILYTAGKGVYRFLNTVDEKEEIVSASNELNFSKINASQFKKEVALWLIGKATNKSGLFYVNNRTYDSSSEESKVGSNWTRPLQMHDNIEEFVSVKGRNLLNQLYLFGQTQDKKQEGLIHFWQDRVSTQWHEQFLNIDNMENSIEIESYTIELAFSSEKMSDLFDKEISISSDENIVIYVNNRRLFLIDETPVVYNIGENSMLNLVYPVKSLQAGKIILSGNFLDHSIEIDPASGVMKELSEKLSSVDALKNAKTKKDKPLVATKLSDGELSKVVNAISQMGDASERLSTTPQLLALKASPQAEMLENSVWDWTQNAVGDLFHAVEKGFETITKYTINLIEEGYKIVIEIAGQVLNFIVDTAKKVVAFVEKIFNSIKAFFKDLFEFLAFLFNWDDILATKEALKGYTLNLFDSFETNVGNFQDYVVSLIQELQDDVRAKLQLDDIEDVRKTHKADGTDSRTNWVGSKKEYISKGKSQGINSLPAEIKDSFLNAFDEIIPYLIKYKDLLINSLSSVADKFSAFFMGDLSLIDFLKYFALSLANVGLELAKDLVTLLFNALKAAIRVVKETLIFSIEIPFFSALYTKISGGAKLSLLDVVCLLVAVPTTVAYKIGVGEAPFKKLNSQEFIDSGKSAFSIELA